jgi:hypothetical protein
MSFDITFCSYEECENKWCLRHISNILDYQHPYSFADFKECEFWKNKAELLKGE